MTYKYIRSALFKWWHGTIVMILALYALPAYSADISAASSVAPDPGADRLSTDSLIINEAPGDFDAIYPDSEENEEALGELPQESKRIDNYRFHWNQTITPAALILAGSIGVNNFTGLKLSIRHHLADWRDGHYLKFDDYIQYLPVAAYLGLGFTRLKSRSDHIDRLMAGVTAYALMAIVVNATKYTVKEMRPDGSRRNSFPSGHSGTVFTGAELMRIEYGNYIGIAGYAVACTVGFLRMYNERHWINDILAGAGIGILSARAAYWLLPLERRLFRRDRNPKQKETSILYPAGDYYNNPEQRHNSSFMATPYYDSFNRGAGIAVTALF